MIFLAILIAAALGYLFGSINSAIITVRLLKHEDVREFGSGNAGLTNTLRCFGKLCALFTLIGDLGKGVLVGVSIFLVLDWRLFCILIGIFALVLLISRYVSLASIIATACCPVVTFLLQRFTANTPPWELSAILIHVGLECIMAAAIIISHHENIKRLREGTERKFGQKKQA